ncbi:MAG: glycerol kinase GlpK [Clostridiales bacterium]|jgi:glycerol kinase|nr:glycerol kinase GlpK [Clostridiales bacterium]
MRRYVLGLDQSTQGTKAMLFDEGGAMLGRFDKPHAQMINDKGWVEHDPEEIYQNTLAAVKGLVERLGADKNGIAAVGISNQRETALAWDKTTGKPVYNAIVWQCARGAEICGGLEQKGHAAAIRCATGLRLSPYFSAAKIAWILQNVKQTREMADGGRLCAGTVDSWLVYRLTRGKEFRTDYSNASRTQLFNIKTLEWDETVCAMFGIKPSILPELTDSDGYFGETDFDGYFAKPIPIHAVVGDSHGALFGQACLSRGMIKATYGTGSSVMMNIGPELILSDKVVTSVAWRMRGAVNYVLEGNINYAGAVITWLKELGLLSSPKEAEQLSRLASPGDTTYLVPAFSGLGAPHWNSKAAATIVGMTRTTGKAELVKAGNESIAYQITEVLDAMRIESGIDIKELRVDGGPTRDAYLMQFQSDIAGVAVSIPSEEELSGIGAAYAAGISTGIYDRAAVFANIGRRGFYPGMDQAVRDKKYSGWKKAVDLVLKQAES